MSNKGKYWDNAPFIPYSGKTTALEGVSVDNSIRQDLYFQPSTITPDEIKKYRDSTRQRVGVKQYHPGIYDDPKDYEDLVHGVPTKSSLHVDDCIKGTNLSGNQIFMNQLKEDKYYASHKREPLGMGLQRDYIFPDQCANPNFKFGVPTTGFYSAKDVMYNHGKMDEDPDVKKLYNKTHGYTDPGQQKDREYVNLPFDQKNHRYGYAENKEADGVKKSLMTDNLTNPYPQTKIVDKRLEDYRQATADMLGQPKFKGTLSMDLPPDHAFGVKSKLGDAWNVGRCINGDGTTVTLKSMEPDPDLGRSVHYASKLKNLQPTEADPNRVCGIPSIRKDLVKGKNPSILNMNNYGDEKDVYELLYPHPCATRGLDDKDFDVLMTKEETKEILTNNNYLIPDEEFNLIWAIGVKNFPTDNGKLSAASFISTMRNLKREYLNCKAIQADQI